MGWDDFHRRRAALDRVVESGELTVPDMFGGPTEVLLALHHRWSLRLAGLVELAASTADPVAAVGAAWRETAAANPALRRLLDEYADHPPLAAMTRAEQRMLAETAGLAADDDPLAQAAAGAALTEPSRGPVERFLRRLVPSG